MKKRGLSTFAAIMKSLLQKNVGQSTRTKLIYASDGSKPTGRRKKVKLARKANLQRIQNHK